MIEGFRHAEASLISPFRYVVLVWAAFIGYVVFGDVPGVWTLSGGGVIVACGLFISCRERVRPAERAEKSI